VVVWCGGMVWCGVVTMMVWSGDDDGVVWWYGVLWYGALVWCGVVWCGDMEFLLPRE